MSRNTVERDLDLPEKACVIYGRFGFSGLPVLVGQHFQDTGVAPDPLPRRPQRQTWFIGVAAMARLLIRHPRAGGSPTGSSGAVASGSVLTIPSSSGYRVTISSRYAPVISRPSWCFSVAALATAFAAKWLFM